MLIDPPHTLPRTVTIPTSGPPRTRRAWPWVRAPPRACLPAGVAQRTVRGAGVAGSLSLLASKKVSDQVGVRVSACVRACSVCARVGAGVLTSLAFGCACADSTRSCSRWCPSTGAPTRKVGGRPRRCGSVTAARVGGGIGLFAATCLDQTVRVALVTKLRTA